MTVSIGTLAQQALRLLGVRIVPLDDSPTLTEMVPIADIATAALVELGVLTGGSTSIGGGIVTPTTIATSALVELGVLNSDLTLAVPATVPQATIATAALTELGVIASDETPSATDQALAIDKVASVHGDLVDQGIALWDIAAIPRAVAEEYTKLTAAMSASSFGKAVDPAIVALLEGRVRAAAQVLTMPTPRSCSIWCCACMIALLHRASHRGQIGNPACVGRGIHQAHGILCRGSVRQGR